MDDNFPIKRQNIRSLFLVILTLIYLFTGAAVFDTLESSTEEKIRQELLESIERFRKKFKMTESEFEEVYNHMVLKSVHDRTPQWDFLGSFFFCSMTLALIGYGHSTPKTTYGKIFTILYCGGGIPLSVIMFQSAGERLNGFLKWSFLKFKSKTILFISFKNKTVSNNELFILELTLTLILLLSGSYVFAVCEGWSYFNSFYYALITLLTIGFGDFVPLQKNNNLKSKPLYAFFTILFIMTGLVILASSINLLVLYLATLNSSERFRDRMRLKQSKRAQMQKMLIGDVISSVNKQDVVTCVDEMPNLAALTEDVSVCSCDDLSYCYRVYFRRLKRRTKEYKSQMNLRKNVVIYKKNNPKLHFSVSRKPTRVVSHLSRHFDNRSDYVIKFVNKTEISLRRLAYEGDFIHPGRKVDRRTSI